MHLQISLKPPTDTFYMPGEYIHGWITCHSSYFAKGMESAIESIRVSLFGECCTFITDGDGSKQCDHEEIMNHSVLLYSVDNSQYQGLGSNNSKELTFKLVVAEHTNADLNDRVGKKARTPLPSSFSDEHDAEHRYIQYWVAVSGITVNGESFIDKNFIRVMSWDPEPRKPALELPRLLSSSPYILQAPGDRWRVVLQWTPLRYMTHSRTEFYGKPMPKNYSSTKASTDCNECHMLIRGPRFVCCDCQITLNWCWACISDSEKLHSDGHVFVRIDKSRNSKDCIQKNLAAKALLSRIRQKKNTPKKGNSVIEVTAESIHVFWLPNRKCYPHGVAIPLLMTVKISSISRATLPELRPLLPWDDSENTSGRINEKRSCLWLSVSANSFVNGRKESTPWRHRSMWPDNGLWLIPESPDGSTGPKSSFSCDWSAPVKNDTNQWVQTAAVCSSIKRVHSYDKHSDEPATNLRNLHTRFKLYYKQKMAGIDIEIKLSEVPWTSGVYRSTSSDSTSVRIHTSTKPLPTLPI